MQQVAQQSTAPIASPISFSLDENYIVEPNFFYYRYLNATRRKTWSFGESFSLHEAY